MKEPNIFYSKKQTLKFFSTFEESNEADAKEMANLTENQHLKNANLLIRTIYNEELKKPIDKSLKFE